MEFTRNFSSINFEETERVTEIILKFREDYKTTWKKVLIKHFLLSN